MKINKILVLGYIVLPILIFSNDIIIEGKIDFFDNNLNIPLTLSDITPEGNRTNPVYPDLTGKFQFSGSFQGDYNLEVWQNNLDNQPIKYFLSITSYPSEIIKDQFEAINFQNEEIKNDVLNLYIYDDTQKKYKIIENISEPDISFLNNAFFNSDFIKKIELDPLPLANN